MFTLKRCIGFNLCLLLAVAALAPATASDSESSLNVDTGQRQLFVDDVGLVRMENLVRVMHAPVKRGAVIRPTPPEEIGLQTRSAPQWDPASGVFKLWLIASRNGGSSGTAYVESPDGLHWTKPLLRQKLVDGSLENNLVTVDPARDWPANAMENVVYDPDDPDPGRRFKALGHCFDREPMVSPDGLHWTLLEVPKLKSSDESNLSYDAQSRRFIATLKTSGPHGRSHALTTSTDFEHWSEAVLTFHADEQDQEIGLRKIRERFADPLLQHPSYNIPETYNVDIYNVAVFRYEGVYLAMPAFYYQTGKVSGDWPGFADPRIPPELLAGYRQSGDWSGFHEVQLMSSRNLKAWERLGDRKPFIECSRTGSGAYDLACVLPPSSPVPHGEELWFYYTGGMNYGLARNKGVDSDAFAVCLAVLRRDGFISLDAGDVSGVVETAPFILKNEALFVNMDAPEGGLRVEVLGDGGTLRTSQELSGDLVRREVSWEDGGLAPLIGQRVSLRFTLRKGSLYSYWFGGSV